jgi:type VI secretion system protein ImpC
MARPFNFGEIKLTASGADSPAVPHEDTPFCIALMGDFTGRSSRRQSDSNLANRRAVAIDRDNFDEVMARLKPALSLALGATALTLQFSELDDFHPDRLFARAEIFRRLREARLRLQDPATFAAAAEELGVKPGPQPSATPSTPSGSADAVVSGIVQSSGGLLDEIVEQSQDPSARRQPSRAPDELQRFVRRVTEPHLVAAADPHQAQLLAVIDRALSSQMRALLHVTAFQELEAAWRAVFFLVRRIETGPQLKLCLIDVTKEELAADLLSSPDLRASGAYRLLVEKTVGTLGAEPWALIAGNYSFGPAREDAESLGRLAKIAAEAGAPFLAAASPRLLGCASLAAAPHPRDWNLTPDAEGAAAWAALRGLPQATALGLALPRFLLRLPYGKKTDAIESFDFEEMPETPAHEDYLWGNPAFACALLLAQSFREEGWDLRPGVRAEIDGLPLHVYQHDGEFELQPCSEALLTEDAAARILQLGVMPLVTLKGRDAVRLVRFQSIADPPRALAGRWQR